MKCQAIKADGYITSKIYLGKLSLRIRIKQQTLKYYFSLSKESEGKKIMKSEQKQTVTFDILHVNFLIN